MDASPLPLHGPLYVGGGGAGSLDIVVSTNGATLVGKISDPAGATMKAYR